MAPKPKQKVPSVEQPDGEKLYEVLRLKGSQENRIQDRGFGVFDICRNRLVVSQFRTPEEASAFVKEHLTSKTEPSQKLRTMNDISAAEAGKLFHAARNFECDGAPMDDYCLQPEYFPCDIAARDFLQCLDLYSRMYSEGSEYPFTSNTSSNTSYTIGHRITDEQRAALAEIAPTLSDEDLVAKELTDAEIRTLHEFAKDPFSKNKEIGQKLNIDENTVKTHLSRICDKLEIEPGRGRRRKLLLKYTPDKP